MNAKRDDCCLSDTRGLATIEYILILSLVTLTGMGAAKALGGSVSGGLGRAAEIVQLLPSESDAPDAFGAPTMGSGGSQGLGGTGGGGGCAAHVARGGGAGSPCDPATFGSCVSGGTTTTVVISCDGGTRLTVARRR